MSEALRGGALEYFRGLRAAVDEAVLAAKRGLPGRHAREVGHRLLEQRDHLGAPALVHAVRDERGSVGHRGVGFAGLLPDLQRLFGKPLPGLQLAARAANSGRGKACVPSQRRLPCLLGDREDARERSVGAREVAQLHRYVHLAERGKVLDAQILHFHDQRHQLANVLSAFWERVGRPACVAGVREHDRKRPRVPRLAGERDRLLGQRPATRMLRRERQLHSQERQQPCTPVPAAADYQARAPVRSPRPARRRPAPNPLVQPRLFASAARAASSASWSSDAIPDASSSVSR